jgi:hypothetical protein
MTQAPAFLADASLVDPSLVEGERILVQKTIRLLMCAPEEEDVLETLQFRTLVQDESENITQIRFEILSDSDLFFFFESAYAPEDFPLKGFDHITFETLPDMVIELFNRNAQDPNDVYIAFVRTGEGRAVLRFEEPVKFRSARTELLVLEFASLSDDLLRSQIQYRFNSSIAELKSATTQLGDLCTLLNVRTLATLSPTSPRSLLK